MSYLLLNFSLRAESEFEASAKVERELELQLWLKTPSGQVDTNCCKVFWHSSVLMSHELLRSRRADSFPLFRTPHMN